MISMVFIIPKRAHALLSVVRCVRIDRSHEIDTVAVQKLFGQDIDGLCHGDVRMTKV